MLLAIAFSAFCPPLFAQRSRTINQRISVQWLDDDHFTFHKQSPDGTTEKLVVDATTGSIQPLNRATEASQTTGLQGGRVPKSESSATDTEIEFVNKSPEQVKLYWIDMNGRRVQYGNLAPGGKRSQHTFTGHVWLVESESGTFYGSVIADSNQEPIIISKAFPNLGRTPQGKSNRRRESRSGNDALSPDKQWLILPTKNSIQLRSTSAPARPGRTFDFGDLTHHDITAFSWSPDSRYFAAWKVRHHVPKEIAAIESSPARGGRAVVKRHPYRLPGDPYDQYELFVIDVDSGKRVELNLPTIDFGYPKLRWFNQHEFSLEKIDRGHQRVRLFVANAESGHVRTVIDDQTDTFIWTMHGPKIPLFRYLQQTNEVIYASECSGYRHLYLIDRDAEESNDWKSNAITSGSWLVREILHVDEDDRVIDLLAGELYADQDPYHRHLVRIRMDQRSMHKITSSDGDHSVQFSPSRDYAVVTLSRVDSPPVHELRDANTGEQIVELARAQRVVPGDNPWAMPHPFHTAGRDGRTQIWGNLYFPADFDPSKQSHYPVIEAIYAGPHDSHVPKRYQHSARFRELTSLGFIVVQIDGMGTANRSKAFHDVCWHNLKDAGFPDRIAWITAAAETYTAMDLSRVGIFGTSAGGQNACGALLFHGDFYRAAYASCGCHDNRMDKASWNEQWMGYPVKDHYADNSNITHAHRLQGDLFLVVGELDTNVPPESTYRLVDALIKADKDFQFLMIPGMGHSNGGQYGMRRMRDFFIKTLSPPSTSPPVSAKK